MPQRNLEGEMEDKKENLSEIITGLETMDKEVKALQSDLSRSEGKVDGLKDRLETEFDLKSFDEATEVLARTMKEFDEQYDSLEKTYNQLVERSKCMSPTKA